MNWHDKKKAAKNISGIIWISILASITYWLYSYYEAENLAEYQRQNAHTDSTQIRHVKVPAIRDTVAREIDSIKSLSIETSESLYTHVNPSSQKTDSSALPLAALPPKNNPESSNITDQSNSSALHGPTAFFSHDYTIAVGKTIPVTVLWADSGAMAKHFKLITIKVNDIADNKAQFTIEDPFDVLLFSQTGYAVNDKILLDDEKHSINISVLQVTAKAAIVKIESHLSEGIVSKLQEAD